jgi:hypothetical protein
MAFNFYNMEQITLDILQSKDFSIAKTGEKNFYNIDHEISLDRWMDKEFGETIFSFLVSDANNLEKSVRSVYFQNTPINNNNKRYKIGASNFMKGVTLFSVRKLPLVTWINEKDEFLAPTKDTQDFSYDSVVLSLFNGSSYQKSINGLNNEFFWMSVDKMKELADQNGYDELYNDARTSPDRYVHKLLFGEERIYDKLSPDAKLVLDKATELVEKSMELRQVMANEENHLNSWDAGYAQLKLVWKEYFQEDFKEFRKLYKNLEDRMRPLVYELGFLKK